MSDFVRHRPPTKISISRSHLGKSGPIKPGVEAQGDLLSIQLLPIQPGPSAKGSDGFTIPAGSSLFKRRGGSRARNRMI
jgi:hypothetical protein